MWRIVRASACLVVMAQWYVEHCWVKPRALDMLFTFLSFCLMASNTSFFPAKAISCIEVKTVDLIYPYSLF